MRVRAVRTAYADAAAVGTAAARPARPSAVRDWLTLMRPQHWVKNTFVAAPLAFAHLATPPGAAARSAALGFVAFCLMSSSVYCFNDVRDAASDRAHPSKRRRPVAAGRVRASTALALAALLAAAGAAIIAAALPTAFAFAAAAYLLTTSCIRSCSRRRRSPT